MSPMIDDDYVVSCLSFCLSVSSCSSTRKGIVVVVNGDFFCFFIVVCVISYVLGNCI